MSRSQGQAAAHQSPGGAEIALLDIKGKIAGQPIHAMLGGALRERVIDYATGGNT